MLFEPEHLAIALKLLSGMLNFIHYRILLSSDLDAAQGVGLHAEDGCAEPLLERLV